MNNQYIKLFNLDNNYTLEQLKESFLKKVQQTKNNPTLDNHDKNVIIEALKTRDINNINNNNLIPLFKSVNNFNESFNQPRQILPLCYLHNGYIDILNSSLLEDYSISGENIIPYVMSGKEYHDIDTENDFKIVEKLLRIKK